jgi:hypothetical protein
MRDLLGNDLNVGDRVVFSTFISKEFNERGYGFLTIGTIIIIKEEIITVKDLFGNIREIKCNEAFYRLLNINKL